MVYTRILYNNIKEYTPNFMKTIPYAQTVKPVLGKRPQIVSKFNADPKVKAFWQWFGHNVRKQPVVWQSFILGCTFLYTSVCYWPWLKIYQSHNKKRSLDYAIAKEKEFKRTQQTEE
mmetsp:Transcript_64503/g.74985  ORF Transcript_64503/g.74985 Transcript_64503/m.74985 type:complete len:117 (-) Transcript_64503:194-544(-)